MSKWTPIPKFTEGEQTPTKQISLYEEISHQIGKMDLNMEIEKQCVQILSSIQIPNSSQYAQAVIHIAMKQLNLEPVMANSKIQFLSSLIETQLNNSLPNLCKKLKMDNKATKACQIMLNTIRQLVNKLPKQIQNALAIKLASDIIYSQYGGINLTVISKHAQIPDAQLRSCLNRVKPFARTILQNYLSHFSTKKQQ
ncbi:unnamed protein product (macronuclear) [Paramecium tetraurelia]|uniref:Uncharacterized protein n=1 Tax=Paramecium tetraurelia TaxID=5888 RepID=A0BEF4_PARTE|nr:uncharacterized protein GSPATT00027954001 [Paramecium tetraurelia]CAK56921.1 unnamed protein product [Paramecium tetraurelia]|eukprot:XP_001424319.1 hypothetical protein (macronuclear) [Paramecium tetraurelia strain d4-2]